MGASVSHGVPDRASLSPVDWERVAAWTEAIMAGDMDEIGRVFVTNGAAAPVLVWRPTTTQLATEPSRHLLAHWSSLADGSRLPSFRQIDPLDLRPALGYIMLLDEVGDAEDFRYRLFGSAISSVSGFDMTGKLVSELPASAYVREFSIAVGSAAARRREPVCTTRRPVGAQETGIWERLVLPLVDDDDRVVRLLVAAAPIDREGALIRGVY